MSYPIDFEKVAAIALQYALTKAAGVVSEFVGNTLNPFNQFGGQVGGGIAALSNNTRTHEDQAKADASILSNLFVPGVAPYNTFKRMGYSLRNTDLQKAKRDLARRKWEEQYEDEPAEKEKKAQTKAANAVAYALTKAAGPNPTAAAASTGAPGFNWQHALMGAGLGAGAGALSGLFAPGKDDEDEDDTTGSAMYRGLLGGGLGGLAGGFGGQYLAPYLSGKSAPQLDTGFTHSDALGTLPGFNNENYPQSVAPHLLPGSSSYSPPKAGPKLVNPPLGDAPPDLPPRQNISFPEDASKSPNNQAWNVMRNPTVKGPDRPQQKVSPPDMTIDPQRRAARDAYQAQRGPMGQMPLDARVINVLRSGGDLGTARGQLPKRVDQPQQKYPAGYAPVTQQRNNPALYPGTPPAGY